jgi:hypothetical protein
MEGRKPTLSDTPSVASVRPMAQNFCIRIRRLSPP